MSNCDGCHDCLTRVLGERGEDGSRTAPVFIRVRPGWLEKALFVAVFIQIMLVGLFFVFGSGAARKGLEETEGNRALVCAHVADLTPEVYERFKQYCHGL